MAASIHFVVLFIAILYYAAKVRKKTILPIVYSIKNSFFGDFFRMLSGYLDSEKARKTEKEQ
jgi:hypothetical protein